ncbi:transcriptional regulator QRICH1-like [Haliotis rufescens]|uniref:transcriptional regulator QRICH1-like n=1 Tax=Haliotis rufescens TaxID=6454 RepID=UPI00201E824F|nr:transcriptional regulator QRICH1-like [Haliotis rufescens]
MKKLAARGIGIVKRKADIISCEQEDILWDKGILGDDTPQKLLDTLLYLNGISFCLRRGEEHHSLKLSNFSFVEKNGIMHLKYCEGITKTNSGGLKHKALDRKTIVVDPNAEKKERCLVRLHQKYLSLRPQSCDTFYLRPLRYPRVDVWFCTVPIGRQTLGGVVKRLCAEAGFTGFFTNHSLRATVATRLYEQGFDEQLISERTGHRSTAIRSAHHRMNTAVASKYYRHPPWGKHRLGVKITILYYEEVSSCERISDIRDS